LSKFYKSNLARVESWIVWKIGFGSAMETPHCWKFSFKS
jgi:hypothetical protein